MSTKTYTIDGKDFSTIQEFYNEIGRVLIPETKWGHNLDALNDILRGGFGTPDEGFILRWENSVVSRQRLGNAETIKWIEEHVLTCHPGNVSQFEQRLAEAKQGRGETLFDTIIEIIQIHGRGGREAQDHVELLLL